MSSLLFFTTLQLKKFTYTSNYVFIEIRYPDKSEAGFWLPHEPRTIFLAASGLTVYLLKNVCKSLTAEDSQKHNQVYVYLDFK